MVRTGPAEQSGAMDNASPSTEQPGPGTPPPSGPRVTRDEMKDLGRLRRSVTDRHIAGVAGGIARHLDVDPIIVRVALVVAAFFGGAGLLLYVGAWILVPEEGTTDEPLGLDQRSRTIALAGVGVLALLAAIGDWAGAFWFPWPLAIVAAIAMWFLHRKEKSTPTSGYGYDGYAAPSHTGDAAVQPGVCTRRGADRGECRTRPRSSLRVGAAHLVRPGTEAAAQPAPPRTDPLRLHAGADRAGRGRTRLWSTWTASRSPTAPIPRWPSGSSRLMLVVGSFWGRAGGLIALGARRRPRHRGRDRQRLLPRRGPQLRADQRRRRPGQLRVRRRPLHPRPVRRLRRRGARRPRHHDRRGRRTDRGRRPRRDGRRRPDRGRRRQQRGLRPAQRRASTSRRTGSSTAATRSPTCPSPSTWSAARSSSAKRPEEHCHD